MGLPSKIVVELCFRLTFTYMLCHAPMSFIFHIIFTFHLISKNRTFPPPLVIGCIKSFVTWIIRMIDLVLKKSLHNQKLSFVPKVRWVTRGSRDFNIFSRWQVASSCVAMLLIIPDVLWHKLRFRISPFSAMSNRWWAWFIYLQAKRLSTAQTKQEKAPLKLISASSLYRYKGAGWTQHGRLESLRFIAPN